MNENQPYNLIDSEMFTSDDGAFQYQYEIAPVGAQSVLPIHLRNNTSIKPMRTLLGAVRPALPVKFLSEKQLKRLSPAQVKARIDHILRRKEYVQKTGKGSRKELLGLTAQLKQAQARLQQLNVIELKARRGLKDKVLAARTRPKPPRISALLRPSAPSKPKTAEGLASDELSDTDEIKAKLNEILMNSADPNYAQVKKIYDMCLDHPKNDCYEFYLTELIRAILSGGAVPTFDLSICGRISDDQAREMLFTLLADPSHPHHKLLSDLYAAMKTAKERGANEDCYEYKLVDVLNQLYYNQPVTAPDLSECEGVKEPTMDELRTLMENILANPEDPDHALVEDALADVRASVGTREEELKEYELSQLLRDIYLARQAKTNPLFEEGWFDKNKWYVFGGAALVGGAALLYFTRKK